MKAKGIMAALLVGLIVLLAGCVSETKIPTTNVISKEKAATNSAKNYEYRIEPNDLLQVEVFQVSELSREARVNGNGEISLPLIGKVVVQNLSVLEAENLLKEKLQERYLKNPQVTITIKEYTGQRVTVEGMVKNPGVFSFKGDATLLHVMAMSQGDNELADTGEIRLLRDNGKGEKESYLVNLNAIRKGEVEDPPLKGNDIIIVQESTGKYVLKVIKMLIYKVIGIGMLIPAL